MHQFQTRTERHFRVNSDDVLRAIAGLIADFIGCPPYQVEVNYDGDSREIIAVAHLEIRASPNE